MKDITVKEIIETFKGVEREEIRSNSKTDNFLDILQKKKHWTIEEYKEFSFEYALEYMKAKSADTIIIKKIKDKYNFKLSWKDYIKVLDSLTTEKKRKQYINYYIYHYYQEMNEIVYKKLIKKPYYKLLNSKNKSNFLSIFIQVTNKNFWIDKYFTEKEIKNAINKCSLGINDLEKSNNVNKEKENMILKFYAHYEKLMNNQFKLYFYYQIIKSGSINLIKIFHEKQTIKHINRRKLLLHIFFNTYSNRVLETLNILENLGYRFKQNDLIKLQNKKQIFVVDHKDSIFYFFKYLKKQKMAQKLKSKLEKKFNIMKHKNELIKI